MLLQVTDRAWKASPFRTQSVLGRIRSSNVRISICSNKLGSSLSGHLTLLFVDIISQFRAPQGAHGISS